MHIECSKCATKLTATLTWVEPSSRNVKMGEQMLEKGQFTQEDGTWLQGRTGAFMANAEDSINVLLTSETKRLNGCCGLDGCDGANLLCEICKTYVATKMTDCWMAHCIVFEESTTNAML